MDLDTLHHSNGKYHASIENIKRFSAEQVSIKQLCISTSPNQIWQVWDPHILFFFSVFISKVCPNSTASGIMLVILHITNLPTLNERREQLCKEYFKKLQNESHKLHNLLPNVRQVPYGIRSINKYPLVNTWTSRYFNSFILWCLRNAQWRYSSHNSC